MLISVHGHGPISEYYNGLDGQKCFISIPCCKNYGIIDSKDPDYDYLDGNIFSDNRRVLIYDDLNLK